MDIIELLKVIFLGIVEGITEWLPVSSTGHMILVDQFMKLKVSEEFWQMFLVVIQLGAVLAVVVLDFKKLWPFHKNDPSRESNWNYISTNERIGKLQKFADKYINMNKIVLWLKILVSCVPAIIVALPFNNWIEKTFMNYWVVSVMLIVYGVLFIVIENYNKSRKPSRTKLSDISFKDALFIGIFQLLALIPGTSRSVQPSSEVSPRHEQKTGSGIYLFPCHPGYVWSKLSETGKIRSAFYRNRGCVSAAWYGCRFWRFHCSDQVPDGLYQETRFQGIWMVPDRSWCCGTCLFPACIKGKTGIN